MADMTVKDYVDVTKAGVIAVSVAGFAWWVYRSGVLNTLLKAAGVAENAFDVADVVLNTQKKTTVDAALAVTDKFWNSETGGYMGAWSSFWDQVSQGKYQDTKGVQATTAYVVIRARDFDSSWKMKDTAYKAAIGMHPGNKAILEKYVMDKASTSVAGWSVLLPNPTLKPALQKLVKTTDFVVVYSDGSFKSA
ncbi:hypothetical protein [Rheinheimera sp.]|uniref:hypothetical protein n=1 Tax=Rheinheimera sp. TaxID=1869214 RepID=UPI003D2D3245